MKLVEKFIFNSRWLLAPFFVGLIFSLLALLHKFVLELLMLIKEIFSSSQSECIVHILTLLDVTLIACLVIIITFSGYEIFVSNFSNINDDDKPLWMGKVTFSDLKLKLITAIIAISSVELLRAIINVENNSNEVMGWKIGVHLTFVFTGVIFALTDYIVLKKGPSHH